MTALSTGIAVEPSLERVNDDAAMNREFGANAAGPVVAAAPPVVVIDQAFLRQQEQIAMAGLAAGRGWDNC